MTKATPDPTEEAWGTPLLAGLSTADAQALATCGGIRRFRAGAFIAREGEAGDALHTVLHGSVRIAMTDATGDEATLTVLGPGDSFGELSLLDGRPRSASAVATESTRTLAVTRADFHAWLGERPGAAVALLEALSLRLRQTDALLADFIFCDLRQRLARRLLALGEAQGRGQRAGAASTAAASTRAQVRLTQSALASMLGVSREHVNKELRGFEQAGWVRLGRGALTLVDAEALRAIASGS